MNKQMPMPVKKGASSSRMLEEAVKNYISIHERNMVENERRWLLRNTQEAIKIKVLGNNSAKLAELRGVKVSALPLTLTPKEKKELKALETEVTKLIKESDVHPIDAVKRARGADYK